MNPPTFDDQYSLQYKLGKGAFGSVFKCFKKATSEKCVAKFVPNGRAKRKALCRDPIVELPVEILVLRQLEHPNIIGFVEYFYEQDTWIIVMEYCLGYVDLHHYMKKMARPFNDVNAAIIINQAVSACLYCRT